MRAPILFTGIVVLFLASCSGINSEGDTAFIPDEVPTEKPRCSFKTTNNCLTKSMALIASCLEAPAPDDVDTFLEGSQEFCTNNSNKLIHFKNPLDLIDGDQIEFTVHNSKRECFHFIGEAQSFEIDDFEYGTLSVETLESGDIQVKCFYGEQFIIPAKAAEKGCHGVSNKLGDYIPRASFYNFQEDENSGFQFLFQGTGGSPVPIYKCYK
jgi:hypothetical protein